MNRPDPNPLDPREESVLKTLIEAYLEAGEPVGSRLLAKRYPEALSSATIRNVLADLEEDRLVSQPHTSAGRVPTERAYRYYVDRWMNARAGQLGGGADPRLEDALRGLDLDPEAWARQAGRVLSEVLQGVCLALPMGLARSRLARLEFVPLPPGRAVAVWVGAAGEVEHRILEVAPDLSPEQMVELGNFASLRFQGLTLPEMQGRLMADLQSGVEEGRQLAAKLQQMAVKWAASEGREEPSVLVSGLGQLGQLPEFDDLERFRGMVAAFEEQELLARLLNAFADQARSGVQLLLGSENPYLAGFPLATLVRTVHLGPAGFVTFALVGPLRMDYQKTLAGLDWWGREVDRRRS
ncbi:MAG TPA: heat-inducible transcriptional repressor HrcA [Holophagaceae bacterium]|nr:heat-inducible transcriptional repressor HrcA [Holophagaceae bacterium]